MVYDLSDRYDFGHLGFFNAYLNICVPDRNVAFRAENQTS